MENVRLGRWLRVLRGTATFVYIAALCVAVAVLVIGFVPGSAVSLDLPASFLTGLDQVGGLARGVAVDRSGQVALAIADPSFGQRALNLLTVLPGLLLVAEIGRRMATVLRSALERDPFVAETARDLTVIAKITAYGGVGVWAVGSAARSALSASTLASGTAVAPRTSPLGWLAVGLICAGFAQLIARGVEMRAELDTVI